VSPGQPAWRRVFDRVERAVGEPLEQAAASNHYIDVIVLQLKLQSALNRALRRTIERQIGAALHLINVPTYSDVRRLGRQLTTLTGEVRALSAATEELRRLPALPQRSAETERDA
jgi:hypothetical protein